jgi:two-component system chemotaxis response regulator CheB
MSYQVVVIGGSTGGFNALASLIGMLPADFPLPILVVLHLHANDSEGFSEHLARETQLTVIEPCDKQVMLPGFIYTAPANYHMLLERDGSIVLSVDEKINWSRPSIDVLFESGARAWQAQVIAILLSGANRDGMQGMLAVHQAGGFTLVQEPASAESPIMPQAAITAGAVNEVLNTESIGKRLMALVSLGNYQPKRLSLDRKLAVKDLRK